ncbi:KpsF/GutQ family sugar-phosphate isomerase [Lutimaribacter sp. EGI FJ00015]|uniref:KpsF/GutQ family sugar-phosphate isomerase n=1 Tax=Lutimaribacter degradans TaxID=2945989 RepID=A0ACC6A102_9RHOB|nr:KpsF/GutQ family sugar-phosphate isomerase [Lutimaribacter sp. EGI FJ00013]MCM2563868.1 KpsF/GutQ family sugar-phosphate isomerase [Lutimaribacter sp. EGI FJ00013]MCO0615060.1 KpsF/GutQ family sugar-phosphate isomerase [Lutimaribacter sp. EGI FJ00015]MCO0637705.1 KpsF/GutQ family sugar-phosphate isomerase [Lutimaribacter sp. EGI FJ00014]
MSDTPADPTHDPATARAAGLRVLQLEAEALSQMAAALPQGFEAAVALILGASGRVIVSGIGKSGHIGRKIAATLASTGTPADFLHAAEASHGDLGMVTRDDVCILISNSGETAELGDLLQYTRRFSVPLIAISSRPGSTLMRAADCPLALPDLPEACAIGLAPTTSTTLTLALGDALAVAVMEARGFSAEDFQTFHPGGKLGAQLMRVEELMHGEDALPLCGPDMGMTDVLLTMTSKRFGIAAMVEEGRLTGVISDGDLRRNIDGLMELRAADIATRDPVTVTPDTLAGQALALLNERKVSVLMVVDGAGAPVGVLHIHDLLRAGVA